MPDKPESATAAQVKADIDEGRTADKVRHFDPAVAPLGTDEEAAGTPTSSAVLAEERERRRGIADNAAATKPQPPETQSGSHAAFGWPLLLLIVLIAAGTGLAMLYR